MGATSTVVEIQTAEVHVLMIGKRQLTQGVYRQLDTVKAAEIRPFGRVRDSKDKRGVHVVGRGPSGALSRASMERPLWRLAFEDLPAAAQHRIYHSDETYGEWATVGQYGRRLLDVRVGFFGGCEAPGFDVPEPEGGDAHRAWMDQRVEHLAAVKAGEFCDLAAVHAEFEAWRDKVLDGLVAEQDRYSEWAALPLIVLGEQS